MGPVHAGAATVALAGWLRPAVARARGIGAGPPPPLGARAAGSLPGPHPPAVSTASLLLRQEGRQARRLCRSPRAAGTEPAEAGSEAQLPALFLGPDVGGDPGPCSVALGRGFPRHLRSENTHTHAHTLFRQVCLLLGPGEGRAR